MCGAFSIRINPWQVRFLPEVEPFRAWKPVYNARPGEWLPIVTEEAPRQMPLAFWGFVPHWAKENSTRAVINARAETLRTKPYFRGAFAGQRCVIPADGFYEWAKIGKGKVPYFFHRKVDQPFAFAGIYDRLPNLEGKFGFAIITTEPNALVAKVHDRMPAMLPDEAVKDWLNPKTDPAAAQQLLSSYPAKLMAAYEVSRAVNYAKNKGREVTEAVKKTGKLI